MEKQAIKKKIINKIKEESNRALRVAEQEAMQCLLSDRDDDDPARDTRLDHKRNALREWANYMTAEQCITIVETAFKEGGI